MARDEVATFAHHLTQVIGRIAANSASPTTYTCLVCGCLCKRGESCPNCALTRGSSDGT